MTQADLYKMFPEHVKKDQSDKVYGVFLTVKDYECGYHELYELFHNKDDATAFVEKLTKQTNDLAELEQERQNMYPPIDEAEFDTACQKVTDFINEICESGERILLYPTSVISWKYEIEKLDIT